MMDEQDKAYKQVVLYLTRAQLEELERLLLLYLSNTSEDTRRQIHRELEYWSELKEGGDYV